MLSEFGFDVLEAGDAAEAYRYVAENFEPDVLVTELKLPDADGTELARRLRPMVPKLRVVFVSVYAPDDPVLVSALSEPSTTYLSKPLDIELLASTIWQLLENGSGEDTDHHCARAEERSERSP